MWIYFVFVVTFSIIIFSFFYTSWGIVSVKLREWSIIDSMSFLLILLTYWVCVIMVVCRFKYLYIHIKPKLFLKITTTLILVLIITFVQVNILCFYILFEFSLIPTMWLIIKWGYQPERLQASLYLIIYTIIGSLPMLCCILLITNWHRAFRFFIWSVYCDRYFIEIWWFLFLFGFLVKLPMYPFHLWLPKAHVEAPVSGSVILARILLKLGGYGIIRIGILYPWLNLRLAPILLRLRLIGGIVRRIICLRQIDLKSLIAYSSIRHMGLILAGALSSCKIGLFGSLLIIVSHGFRSSALFILANINYDSCNSRRIIVCKGVLLVVPIISLFWFIFAVMNIAAPPFINLVREISIMIRITFIRSFALVFVGVIRFLTLCYSLNMYAVINHGRWRNYLCTYNMVSLKDYVILIYMLMPSLLLLFKIDIFILLEFSW